MELKFLLNKWLSKDCKLSSAWLQGYIPLSWCGQMSQSLCIPVGICRVFRKLNNHHNQALCHPWIVYFLTRFRLFSLVRPKPIFIPRATSSSSGTSEWTWFIMHRYQQISSVCSLLFCFFFFQIPAWFHLKQLTDQIIFFSWPPIILLLFLNGKRWKIFTTDLHLSFTRIRGFRDTVPLSHLQNQGTSSTFQPLQLSFWSTIIQRSSDCQPFLNL